MAINDNASRQSKGVNPRSTRYTNPSIPDAIAERNKNRKLRKYLSKVLNERLRIKKKKEQEEAAKKAEANKNRLEPNRDSRRKGRKRMPEILLYLGMQIDGFYISSGCVNWEQKKAVRYVYTCYRLVDAGSSYDEDPTLDTYTFPEGERECYVLTPATVKELADVPENETFRQGQANTWYSQGDFLDLEYALVGTTHIVSNPGIVTEYTLEGWLPAISSGYGNCYNIPQGSYEWGARYPNRRYYHVAAYGETWTFETALPNDPFAREPNIAFDMIYMTWAISEYNNETYYIIFKEYAKYTAGNRGVYTGTAFPSSAALKYTQFYTYTVLNSIGEKVYHTTHEISLTEQSWSRASGGVFAAVDWNTPAWDKTAPTWSVTYEGANSPKIGLGAYESMASGSPIPDSSLGARRAGWWAPWFAYTVNDPKSGQNYTNVIVLSNQSEAGLKNYRYPLRPEGTSIYTVYGTPNSFTQYAVDMFSAHLNQSTNSAYAGGYALYDLGNDYDFYPESSYEAAQFLMRTLGFEGNHPKKGAVTYLFNFYNIFSRAQIEAQKKPLANLLAIQHDIFKGDPTDYLNPFGQYEEEQFGDRPLFGNILFNGNNEDQAQAPNDKELEGTALYRLGQVNNPIETRMKLFLAPLTEAVAAIYPAGPNEQYTEDLKALDIEFNRQPVES